MLQRDDEHALLDWILRYATAHDDLEDVLAGFCTRLIAAGCPILRASIDLPIIHPLARAATHQWWRDRPAAVVLVPHGPAQQAIFERSPVFYLESHGREAARWRLDAGEGVVEFDLLAGLRRAGGTDYLLRLIRFSEGDTALRGVGLSIATDRPGGFTSDEIAAINRLTPALGLAAYRIVVAKSAFNALGAYLGNYTAKRVIAGEIRRGEGRTISAAIFHADLKSFTALSEREDPLAVVAWLNEHLDAIGTPILDHGGEILKFMGDGLLAVFPVAQAAGLPCAVCGRALDATEEALAANRMLNERRRAQGLPSLEVDLALHYGDVVYGNIGSGHRLDFTVIGRAVNEASRMETLCDELECHLVLSEVFAARCAVPTIAVGRFALRGIAGERTIYVRAP